MSPRWVLKPFPRLPAELVQHIVVCGADTVGLSAFSRPGDEREGAAEAARWLSTCCLVSSDWLVIAQPLLFAHISLGSIPACHLLLRSLACPLPSVLGTHRPLWSLVRTFTYAAWSPALEDGSAALVEYSEVVSLRKALLKFLLLGPTKTIVFPTVTYPLLRSLVTSADTPAAANGAEPFGPPMLHELGTVLAVENVQLSRIFAAPAFDELGHLSIWYGDPATGPLFLPSSLRSLGVRCDHFDQGNNILLPVPAHGSSCDAAHLPLLETLRFEFTTRRYPEASPWGPVPLLLSNVGPTVKRLGLACDRGSSPTDQTLHPLALSLCPQLEVLELTNHRLTGPGGGWTDLGHRRLSEIHYRLDSARPFALAPAIPVLSPDAAVERNPVDFNPPVVDSLALVEIGTLLRSPALLAEAFPALRTLSIGRLPSEAVVARSGTHVRSQLMWLASLPRLAAEAGVRQIVEVTDEWHRPLGPLLAARSKPFVGRSLEVEQMFAADEAILENVIGPRRSIRIANKSVNARASPQIDERASTASPASSIEAVTPGSSTGCHRSTPISATRKRPVQNNVQLGAILVASPVANPFDDDNT